MTDELEKILDPEERLTWLHARGRKDAQIIIEKGAPGSKEIYIEYRKLPSGEQAAYHEGYRERMYERAAEKAAAGIPAVSPDYRGPLTEKDWWRGLTVTPPPSPERPRRP